MIDDANFVGGRLRLTAFLRVVEGDTRQSHSLCQRRAPLVKQSHDTGPSPIEAPHPRPSIIPEPLENRQEEVSPEFVAHAGTEFHLPRSPVTIDVDLGSQVQNETKSFQKRRTPAKVFKATKKQATRTANAMASSSTPHKRQDKQKRRLPVHELALLRTSTSDGGLPVPGDAHEAHALAIGELDPIDDSPLNVPGHLSEQLHIQKTTSNSHCRSQLNSLCPTKQTSQSIPRPRPLSLLISKQHFHTGSEFVADGFEAHELKISPPSRPRRREKTTRRHIKTIALVDGLTLVRGSLPPPGAHYADTFVPLGDSSCRLQPVVGTTEARLAADQSTDHSNDSRALVIDGQVQSRQAKRLEHAVDSQLASITAPVRCDSESSEDDTSSEECSFGSDPEDEKFRKRSAHTDSRPPTLLRKKATLVQDLGYFEHAMHHLDTDENKESSDDDFWSQYNVME